MEKKSKTEPDSMPIHLINWTYPISVQTDTIVYTNHSIILLFYYYSD